jgi:hypothetical protein
MLKKIMVVMFTSIVSLAYIEAYADINSAKQIRATVKIADTTPNIKLAVNDVMQLPSADKKRGTNKDGEAQESVNQLSGQLSNVSGQVWLILTALLCFVMRSSRRIV